MIDLDLAGTSATWLCLCAARRRGRLCAAALVLVPGVGVGARHSWCIVARMRKLPLATVTLVCWSQRCLALLAANLKPDLPSSTSAS